MEYRLMLNEEERTLTVTPRTAGEGKIAQLEGREYCFRSLSINANELLLEVDGRLVPIFIATEGSKTHISIRGETYLLEDQAALRVKRRERPDELARQVTPPMPAAVIRILVIEGARVKRGEALLVVSAMKMESTLVAPYPGLVKKINTTLGAQVKPGDILVEIAPEEGENGN